MDRSRIMLFLVVVGFLAIMFAVIIYGSMGIHPYSVESCITFHGRSACGTAAGATREQALAAAANIACSSLAGGVTDSIACGNTPPDSVRWIEE